jgi:hypothetical protein
MSTTQLRRVSAPDPWTGEQDRARGPKPYLSIHEVSLLTPWTEQAIRTMMARGVLKLGVHYFDVGRRRVFKWTAVVDFIEGKREEERHPDRIPLRSGGYLGEPEEAQS